MARVSIEQSALTDPRFRLLAKELGVDVWSAIGRMAVVWNHCTETNAHELSAAVLNCLFDDAPQLAEAIVKAQLGRKQRQGVYICGSTGRIEWLEQTRVNGRKGGRPKGKPTANLPVSETEPAGLLTDNPPALASASAPSPAPKDKARRAPRTIFPQESPAMLLAGHLRGSVSDRVHDVDLQAWARDFQKLLSRGRDFDTLQRAISFATTTQPENFLSAGAFASKWPDGSSKLDSILAKMAKASKDAGGQIVTVPMGGVR